MTTPPDNRSSSGDAPLRKPEWLKRKIAYAGKHLHVQNLVASSGLHTVCREASCPNRSECYSNGTATFLVMGAVCTRRCRFCGVGKGAVAPLDWTEIERVVEAVRTMQLRHAVITSVTRDDLDDGGASFFAKLVETFRRELPEVTVELLIPDLGGDVASLQTVFESRPDILNHNIETVPSLYAVMRPQADYARSLKVLHLAALQGLVVKSGMMVGLGESAGEVCGVLDDLFANGCSIVTIGQYLQPSPGQHPVAEYVNPEQFERYKEYGMALGFKAVLSGPFVRSSYHAADLIGHTGAESA